MSFGGRAAKLSALFNDDDDFDGGGLFGNVAKDDGGDPFKYQRPADPLKPKPKPKPKPQPAAAAPASATSNSSDAGDEQLVARMKQMRARKAPDQKSAYILQLTLPALYQLDATTRAYTLATPGAVGCVVFGASHCLVPRCVLLC